MWTGKIPKGRVNSGFLSELSLVVCNGLIENADSADNSCLVRLVI